MLTFLINPTFAALLAFVTACLLNINAIVTFDSH